MQKTIRLLLVVATAAVIALAGAGCSPKARRARHLATADRYFTAGQYDQAEIEYLNVLKGDAQNAHVIARLGTLYLDQGRLSRAGPFLMRANQLQPDNPDIHVRLGMLYLAIGQAAKARNDAQLALARRPDDPDAPLLLAEASVKSDEVAATRQLLRSLPAPASAGVPVLVAIASLDIRQRRFAEAETALIRAQTIDPKSSAAWAAMGVLRLAQNDRVSADQAFKQAADVAPVRSPRRLQYAVFKIQTGDIETGRRLLEEMTRATPDFLPAWIRLAELAAQEKKYDDGLAAIARVLARDPANPEAMILNGRLLLAKGETDKAVTAFEAMQSVYPASPQASYQLGMAYLAKGDAAKATEAFNHVLSLAPDSADARYMLASLSMRKGDPGTAIVFLKQLLQQHPGAGQARLLLADAYRAQGNLDDALTEYRRLEAASPRSPVATLLAGLVLTQQGKTDEARQSFAKALELAPEYLPALEQLVDLDLGEKQYAAAIQRVRDHLAKNPKLPGLQLLLAKIFFAQKDMVQAEAALRKAIELEPGSPAGYFLLARVYFSTHQEKMALANLEQVMAKDPNDISALMLTAIIREQQNEFPAARDAYEKLLAINPKFAPALNNLAYLYSERLNQMDRAFELAQRARELVPNEPHAADTLGWILYKRHQLPWALNLLEESAAKLSTEPEVQYHLAMVHYMMGEETPARLALQRALQLSRDFPGADEARQCLSILDTDVARTSSTARPALEKTLSARPGDPIALARLAILLEQDGAVDKAIDTWQAAVKTGASNVNAWMNLARLHAAHGDSAQALEEAKTARKLAPDDPNVAQALGRLAIQAGDRGWAASLLQQAAGRRPDDPDIQCDLAGALYGIGRVGAAQTAMRRALDLAAGPGTGAGDGRAAFTRAEEARNFLDMVALAADPARAVAEKVRVQQAVKSNANDVPALMAMATIDEQTGDVSAATETYEKVIGRYPDFSPAKRRLAIIYAARPADDQKAYELGAKAREAFPDDPEVAKALGIITYRLGNFSRALSLLQESAAKRSDDAELTYYLGMAQKQLTKSADARKSLQRALELGLKGDQAADARRALAELK